MTEFVSFFGSAVASSPHEALDRKKLVARSGAGLYPAYTLADIKACIDKIQAVRFREHVVSGIVVIEREASCPVADICTHRKVSSSVYQRPSMDRSS